MPSAKNVRYYFVVAVAFPHNFPPKIRTSFQKLEEHDKEFSSMGTAYLNMLKADQVSLGYATYLML